MISSEQSKVISLLVNSKPTNQYPITGVLSLHIHRFCPHSRAVGYSGYVHWAGGNLAGLRILLTI